VARQQTFLDDPTQAGNDPYAALVGGMGMPSMPSVPMGGVGGGAQSPTSTAMPFLPPVDTGTGAASNPNALLPDPNIATPQGSGAPPPHPVFPEPSPTPLPDNPPTPQGPTPPPSSSGGWFTPPPNTTMPTWGGGWGNADSSAQTLRQLMSMGMTPQQAIDQINAGIPGEPDTGMKGEFAYYPKTDVIGAPHFYLAKNAQGAWDLIQRAGPEGGGGTPATAAPRLAPPITPGAPNVGNDPFSQLVTGKLTNLINAGGMTPEEKSVFATLSDIIGRSGRMPSEDPIVQQQLETAREQESGAFTGQMNDARGELAQRGLLGEPGVPQGEEGGAIARVTQAISPAYAGAVRDINTASIQRQNDRLTSALTSITGLSEAGASQLLSALGEGTQRQSALADIALRTLAQNNDWNKFLATFGLQQDQLLTQVQSGNMGMLLTLINLWNSFTGTSAQGQV
jgi:hypothetical protein